MEETIKHLDTLLNEGRTDDVLRETHSLLERMHQGELDGQHFPEVSAIRGMAYYRRKEFEQARTFFHFALERDPANERAIYGMAYLAAYVDKDRKSVEEYTDKLPHSPARDNALVIFARSPEFINLPDAETWVTGAIERWVKQNPGDPLNVANICHNAARFYLAKKNDEDDTKVDCAAALALLTMTIGLYGTGDMNLHHRAAANYWMSVAMEKLFGPAAALGSAEQSLELWKRQLELDPTNKHFEENYENAIARVDELRENAYSLERHGY